ncbi:MAG: DUF3488 domain-containing protein [Gammaproteobacteria bacterium]|nr:MAG: DUF3488 domain-containing protein [Gammaproteobacteria bacterium]
MRKTMQPNWQTPRGGLLWMLVGVAVAVGLHIAHLPIWIVAAAVLAIILQVQVYRGAWGHPPKYLKVLLMVFCIGGVLSSYGRLVGLEPMVALLISGFLLKLLEIHHRRDALILVFLAYFVVVIQFLFEQSVAAALLVILGLIIVTAALVGLYQSAEQSQWGRPLRQSSVLILQSLPLMLVLFMIMPRIGALWSVPRQQHSAVTGVSDSMSPGDFTSLSGSSKVAFRVEFDGEVPAQSALYWRGLVFSSFDGRRWKQQGSGGYSDGNILQWYGAELEPWDSLVQRRGEPLAYAITMETSNSPWLFALATPVPDSAGIALTRDFRLYSKLPVTSEKRYRVKSWLDYQLEPQVLPAWQRQMALALPDGFNPETRKVAEAWRDETPSPAVLIDRLLDLYNREFVYTLKPPLLGKHTVDEFLWGTKRGFCEFFASSFVVFMRAAGVPARVVVGYQGGERHPGEDYLLVHQYDAHAWAEVWLDGRGWVRVDPTAAVAPQRVESGFADLFAQTEGFLEDSPLSLERYQHISWLNNIRLRLDALDYAWAKWVLGYENVQTGLLTRILGSIEPLRIGLFLLVAGGIAMLPMVVMLYWGREKIYRDDLDQFFLQFCRRMEHVGIKRHSGEGPRDYAMRIALLKPELGDEVGKLSSLYELQRYQGRTLSASALRSKLRRFRPAFKSRN